MAEINYAEDQAQNRAVRHESRDVSIRAVLWFTCGLIATAVAVHLALWLLFAYFVTDETEKRGPAPPLAADRPRLPAGPVLEEVQRLEQGRPQARPSPQADSEQTDRRDGYEWADRKAGVVRIPVEEAMTMQMEKLPIREGAARAQKARRAIPTDAGSGRFVERGGQP